MTFSDLRTELKELKHVSDIYLNLFEEYHVGHECGLDVEKNGDMWDASKWMKDAAESCKVVFIQRKTSVNIFIATLRKFLISSVCFEVGYDRVHVENTKHVKSF